jgi:RNA polymerase sigma factor (TIGR02999 family)
VPDLTEAFLAFQGGDRQAFDRIFAALYPELTRLARSRLRAGQRMTLVDTSMLVHECFLRFLNAGEVRIESRGHFFAYAARVMRSIVVDFARKRQAEVRGGGREKVVFDTALAESLAAEPEDQVVEIADAIERLARLDERLAGVVEMRFFVGLSEVEIAAALGVTERTVRRDFEKARLLLAASLGG